jgi:hypothetical protein
MPGQRHPGARQRIQFREGQMPLLRLQGQRMQQQVGQLAYRRLGRHASPLAAGKGLQGRDQVGALPPGLRDVRDLGLFMRLLLK